MGLRPGEKIEVLRGPLRVVSVRREIRIQRARRTQRLAGMI